MIENSKIYYFCAIAQILYSFLCNSSLVIKIPRGNRTGPWGQGPRTGRALGYCAGYPTPGYTKGPRMGWGSGIRGGRGRGWWNYPGFFNQPIELPSIALPPWTPQYSPEDESKYLEESLNVLKKEIEMIEKRLEELSGKKKE